MHRFFVTSSGTEIGKTWVMRCLIAGMRARGQTVRALKPVISGWDNDAPADTDTAHILEALDTPIGQSAIDAVSPWRFSAALSPDMAARREDRSIDFEALLAFSRDAGRSEEDVLLIEGVGGVMVPLDDRHTVLDWMGALGHSAILVVGSYLGTISHTLTAHAALRAHNIEVPLLVLNESGDSPVPMDETKEVLGRFIHDSAIVTLARRRDGLVDPRDAARLVGSLF